jgi:hypothetical protein
MFKQKLSAMEAALWQMRKDEIDLMAKKQAAAQQWNQYVERQYPWDYPVHTDDALPASRLAQMHMTKPSAPVAVVDRPSMEMLEYVPVVVDDVNFSDPRNGLATEAESLLGYSTLRKEVKGESALRRTMAKLEIEILDPVKVKKYKQQMADHMRTGNKMSMPTWKAHDLREYNLPVPEFVLSKCVEIKKELPGALFYVEQLHQDPFMIVTTMGRYYDGDAIGHPSECMYLDVWDEPKFEGTL